MLISEFQAIMTFCSQCLSDWFSGTSGCTWRKMQRWKTSLTLSSRILRVPHWGNTGYPSWRWSSFWHKISTHSEQATGLSSNPHSSSCFLGCKFMISTSMVGIFLISLQCLITFLSNRLLSWKMVCLHSQWQETRIRVLPWTYGSSRQWIRALAILNNEKQLLSNTRNVNNINRVRRAVHHHANRKRQGKGRHADCSLSKMKKDEQAVQDISSVNSSVIRLTIQTRHFVPFSQESQPLMHSLLIWNWQRRMAEGKWRNSWMRECIPKPNISMTELCVASVRTFQPKKWRKQIVRTWRERLSKWSVKSVVGLIEHSRKASFSKHLHWL